MRPKDNPVKISNQLARKGNTWTAQENKAFIMGIANLNSDSNEVELSKVEFMEYVGLGNNYDLLRPMLKKMMLKSFIEFGNEEIFDDGFLVNRVRTSKHKVFIRFGEQFVCNLLELKAQYTYFYLENTRNFKSKYSICLYQFLRSWVKPELYEQKKDMYTSELFDLFNLTLGKDYCDKEGVFRRFNFEQKTIKKAIEEINADGTGLKILSYEKKRDRKRNIYYTFTYCRTNNLNQKIQGNERYFEPEEEEEQLSFTDEQLDMIDTDEYSLLKESLFRD